MRTICFGIAASALSLLLPACLTAANYPFPPTASWTYPYGIKPANPSGASWPADWTTLGNKWATYKSNYVTTSGAPANGARIICSAQQSGDTVSEGIGYGMILAVYFNDQTTFNELWVYEQSHLDSLGLMNWDISSGGSVIGSNSASDGDEDIAYALWLASYQWGNTGTYDYKTLAQNQTTLVQDNDLDGNLRVKPGDSFDSCEYPSYFMPSEYTVFGYQGGDSGTWNTVSSNSYGTISAASNATSGLIADQTGDTGTGGGCSGVSSTEDQYNSCRVPFYMALDWVYNGNSSAQTELGHLAGFFNNIGPGSVDDCYTVNVGGTSSACSTNINHSAFIGPAGCALMVSSAYAVSLQSYYSYLMALGTTSYFDDSWNLLSLLLMQGNMPNIADPAAIFSPTPTSTETPYAGSPTPTPTITPIANGVVFENFEYGQLSDGYIFAYTGSSVTQTVTSTEANTGIYSDELQMNVVKGATYQYGGGGFDSNYANNQGVVDASGTTSLDISFMNTGSTALTVYVDFKEGGTPAAAVDGGHGYQWDSPPQVLAAQPGWQHFSIALSSFTWDTSNNPTTTPPAGDTGLVLTSVMSCQIQTNAVWTGTIYVDDVDFMPTAAFTPTPSPTPLNNPYTEIWDDFESPLSLSHTSNTLVGCCNAYCTTTAGSEIYDAAANVTNATGASASWALTMTAADYVDGTHGGALNYNTGSDVPAAWGVEGTDVSPYGNAQLYSNDSGAAYLAFYIKAPAGFRYQTEFQEAGTPAAPVDGADGAAWISAMQTAAPGSNGWQYVELPIANFTEDPYDTLCNPSSALPSPCLSEGDTEQMQAIEGVSFKLAAGQGSGTLCFDDIAFITTWKTPTASPSPTVGASFTRSPTPTASPSPTWTDSPTATSTASPTSTATPSATPTASPTSTPTASPTATSTASPTATPTTSPTASPTISPTFTPVPVGSTDTPTPTISPTFTSSPTASPTASPTETPSSTDTGTSSPSPTSTASSTGTSSPSVTVTWTYSAGPSATDTATASPTASPTASATASPTASPTDSATASPTASPTATPTWTYSVGPSGTPTATPTLTPSFTPTATPSQTWTATPSATPSGTPGVGTATPSATPQVPVFVSATAAASSSGGYTITVTGSNLAPGATILVNDVPLLPTSVSGTAGTGPGGTTVLIATDPSGSGSVTIQVANPGGVVSQGEAKINLGSTPTATPGSTNGALILATLPVPNPNPAGVMVNLGLSVDAVTLKVYSSAFHLVGTYTSGPLGPGWRQVSLPTALDSAANGPYYYLVQASRNGGTLKGKVGKLYILR